MATGEVPRETFQSRVTAERKICDDSLKRLLQTKQMTIRMKKGARKQGSKCDRDCARCNRDCVIVDRSRSN